MISKSIIVAAIAAMGVVGVAGAPIEKRTAAAAAAPGQADIDAFILNYALTLEHLDNAFFRDNLQIYDAAAFKAAGYPDWVRQRFVEMGGHEVQHVAFLTQALTAMGVQATQECSYNFNVTDVDSFVATAGVLEGVGNSAYLGSAVNITNPENLAAAGSIMSIEARHDAWAQSAATTGDGFANTFYTPLTFNQTFTLASGIITSCPASNPSLPLQAFPALSVSGTLAHNQTITVAGDGVNPGQYAAFLSGLDVYYVQIGNNNTVQIPPQVGWGRLYLMITNTMSTATSTVPDDIVVAGPAIIQIQLPADQAEKVWAPVLFNSNTTTTNNNNN